MRAAEAMCRVLHDEGVRYVFGVPGNTEIPLLDALSQEPEIKYVSAIHEAVSMGMADGYARASGKPAVVLVHTTPGTAYDLGDVDFLALAKGFGIRARRIDTPSEIGPALRQAIDEEKPALLDLTVDPRDVGWGLPRLP